LTHPYTEDALVEQPAADLLLMLGWEVVNAYGEGQGDLSITGRQGMSEVVLTSRLVPMLERLNPGLPPSSIQQAADAIVTDRSILPLVRANQEVWRLLRDGVRVTVPRDDGGETLETVRVIDWADPGANDFLAARQFWVSGQLGKKRPDIVGFVNGIPLVVFELKASHKKLRHAFEKNISDYRTTVPQLFWPNALVVASNGSEARVGSVSAGWEHYAEWKKINSEGETGVVSLDTLLRATCAPARLLDIVANFTTFQEVKGGLIKLVAKNHQYLGVNNAIDALEGIKTHQGRLGVFWHTQGSGKSVSMVFFCQKVLRQVPGKWTFVIVTDRKELDDQIYGVFQDTGAVTEGHVQAGSGKHLKRLLREDHRYIFTLIHKFRTERGETYPVVSERSDIIVITDEAHRSQYDLLALNMRNALPNASFLGFTGTPLIVGEEKTREVFGDYVSIYDFKASIDDGATVPLFYENRIPELQLTNEDFNRDMERLLEDAALDPAQERKLAREFSREYHLITREDRLKKIAEDLVEHFMGRGWAGKAMVVAIDKATAVRMYDNVQAHWKARLARLRAEWPTASSDEQDRIEDEIRFMEETDMAVVVSQGQNEIAEMAAKGLDIEPHRKRMVREDLETKFKDPADPFRIVFVCAMWMTGFDAPACSTIYLDKPMRNHTLMQTIARANRVFGEKTCGLIVDYIGVFRNLQAALAIYGTGGGPGEAPVLPKDELVAALRVRVTDTVQFCSNAGASIEALIPLRGFPFIAARDDAVELLVMPHVKSEFLSRVGEIDRLFKAILPDRSANEFGPYRAVLVNLAETIQSDTEIADISGVMEEVDALLDQSVAAEAYVIRAAEDEENHHLIDLSTIDFEALSAKFAATTHKRTEAERLKTALQSKATALARLNPTRIDYMERLQHLIDAYNAGSLNLEEFFRQLTQFARSLTAEEQRTVVEGLTEEQMAIFDLLTRPDIELSESQRGEVKRVARELLETLRERLVLDWRRRQQTRAAVRLTIEQTLDHLPEPFTLDLYRQKVDRVYQHVYDSYWGEGKSIYEAAA
jgi:type I restriction enzyme R subunit